MRSARVVADHAAKGAIGVCRWIRSPRQPSLAGLHSCVAQLVADGAGQHTGPPLRRVYLEDSMHVLRPVDNNGNIAALSCQARACTAGEQRSTKLPSGGDCLYYVFFRSWNDHANGDLAII